ncbi:major facilitator superfamily domain-containing protein [Dipodascopsis uninucleata]
MGDTIPENINLEKAEDEHLDYSGTTAQVSEVEKRLVRKVDFILLPMLWLMYFLNFMDRQAITNGKLNTLEEDLNLKGIEYNTCISILFAGYLFAQIPSNMIITRVRPRYYLSICMMTWALVSALTALVHNYTGMILVRFFLGVVEAPFYPGALYLLSLFYTKKELSFRIAIIGSGNVLASSFAGLITIGIFKHLDQAHNIAGWRWLFIINGAMTFFISSLALIVLADTPLTTWWLSESERQLAFERVLKQTTEESGSVNVWRGLKQAVLDPKTWLLSLMMNFHVMADGFKNFFPSVVKTLGFSTTITLVMTSPPYLAAVVVSFLLCYSSGRFNERAWHITTATVVALVGFIIGASTTNVAARYTGMVLFTMSTAGTQNICLEWTASTLGQTVEKKAVALSMANTIGNLASVYSSYLWPNSDAPRYAMGMSASAAFCFAYIILVWIMRTLIVRENNRIKRENPHEMVLYAY